MMGSISSGGPGGGWVDCYRPAVIGVMHSCGDPAKTGDPK